ncbi:hypothetical protein QBC35DRAFT_483173 [Podospora australis]|uniref:Inositol-1-monophosphatase n=1 Tax=Podospora australis TaxID=1536484 RepID=A0AAN6X4I0_9PEZI|nr:hypothetical protein QBC35DRAFT_483173 [Podospora australis]
MADQINLNEIHDTLVAVAFQAGAKMKAAKPSALTAGTKMNAVDIVTETDQAIEALVSSILREKYPSFSFVGEETYVKGVTKVTDAPTFICDPIDGTQNFVHGFPAACISLGFTLNRKPVVGVVYNPFADVLYTGISGQGSYFTDNASLEQGKGCGEKQRLPLTGGGKLGNLSTCLVGIEFGSERDGDNFELKIETFRKLAASKRDYGAMAGAIRSQGSAALNVCAVASGVMDCYWEGGCYAWDVAAGWCILTEAGGVMVSGNPGNWKPEVDERKYLAVRGASEGQKELIEEFWALVGEGRMDYTH